MEAVLHVNDNYNGCFYDVLSLAKSIWHNSKYEKKESSVYKLNVKSARHFKTKSSGYKFYADFYFLLLDKTIFFKSFCFVLILYLSPLPPLPYPG